MSNFVQSHCAGGTNLYSHIMVVTLICPLAQRGTGRPSCQSSLLSAPNAKFSVEMWRKPPRTRKVKNKKRRDGGTDAPNAQTKIKRSNIRRAATSALTFMTFIEALIENWPIRVNERYRNVSMFRQLTDRLSLKYQRPAVERAKPFCLFCREFRRLDSRKTPTVFAGMGSANKYPWTDRQPADASSWR
jgi:hypothetical protein